MLSPSSSKANRLVVFNLATDLDNYLLAHSHEWIEELSHHFVAVDVISTHVGRFKFVESVKVHEIGGGSTRKRAVALLRLAGHFFRIVCRREKSVVFHHMSSRTLGLLGWLFRLQGIPQGIWYAHSGTDCFIKIGINSSNFVFVPHKNALNIGTRSKVIETGHGVKFPPLIDYKLSNSQESGFNEGVIVLTALGRIAKVKKIEELISAVKLSPADIKDRIRVELVGPIHDKDYLLDLQNLAKKESITLSYCGVLVGKNLWDYLFNHVSLIYNGMKGSIDKAPLVAASLGVPVLTTNIGLQNLTGMNKYFLPSEESNDLVKQVVKLSGMNEDEILSLKMHIIRTTRTRNNLENTINIIASNLRG